MFIKNYNTGKGRKSIHMQYTYSNSVYILFKNKVKLSVYTVFKCKTTLKKMISGSEETKQTFM